MQIVSALNGVVVGVAYIAPNCPHIVSTSSVAGATVYEVTDNIAVKPGYNVTVEGAAPPVFTAPVSYPTVRPLDFKLLFTTAEYIAIKASNDSYIEAFYELVQDALSTNTPVYLGTLRVQEGLTYMSANPTAAPILAAGRAAQISAGTVPTS